MKAIAATDQLQSAAGTCTKQYFFSGGFGPNGDPMSMDDYVNVRIAERVAVRFAIVK